MLCTCVRDCMWLHMCVYRGSSSNTFPELPVLARIGTYSKTLSTSSAPSVAYMRSTQVQVGRYRERCHTHAHSPSWACSSIGQTEHSCCDCAWHRMTSNTLDRVQVNNSYMNHALYYPHPPTPPTCSSHTPVYVAETHSATCDPERLFSDNDDSSRMSSCLNCKE